MGFTVYRTGDINTNERLIAFYKKELWASHILDRAKKQMHYWTKWYRRAVEYRFPSARRYKRIKAIISHHYINLRNKYNILAQLWKRI